MQIFVSRTVFVLLGRVSETAIRIPRTAGDVDVLTASKDTSVKLSPAALTVSRVKSLLQQVALRQSVVATDFTDDFTVY